MFYFPAVFTEDLKPVVTAAATSTHNMQISTSKYRKEPCFMSDFNPGTEKVQDEPVTIFCSRKERKSQKRMGTCPKGMGTT